MAGEVETLAADSEVEITGGTTEAMLATLGMVAVEVVEETVEEVADMVEEEEATTTEDSMQVVSVEAVQVLGTSFIESIWHSFSFQSRDKSQALTR